MKNNRFSNLIVKYIQYHRATILNAVKWMFFLLSFGYLISVFMHLKMDGNFIAGLIKGWSLHSVWLVWVIFLLPFNWISEAYKWKVIVSGKQRLTLKHSLKAILAGSSTAFFSPNRTAEFVGRALYFSPENRILLIPFSMINSLTQNMILVLCGCPTAVLFFFITKQPYITISELIRTGCILIALTAAIFLVYFLLKRMKFSGQLHLIQQSFFHFEQKKFLSISAISLVRYCIFSCQFYCMLRFFGVELTGWQALLAIPTNYLLVTLTPAFAFSEAGIRGSIAALIIGAFSTQLAEIALAGISIWFINFVIPMAIGSVILLFHKRKLSANSKNSTSTLSTAL